MNNAIDLSCNRKYFAKRMKELKETRRMRNLSVKDKTQPRETKVHHHKTPRTRILDKECHPEENILSMQLLKLGNLRPGSPFILSTRVFNSLVTPMISLSHKITTVPRSHLSLPILEITFS